MGFPADFAAGGKNEERIADPQGPGPLAELFAEKADFGEHEMDFGKPGLESRLSQVRRERGENGVRL